MTPEALYVISDMFAVTACFGMVIRLGVLIRRASRQVAPVRRAMVKVGVLLILLFVTVGFFIGADTVNILFHQKWNVGRLRNFGVGFAILIVGEFIVRNLAVILAHIERPPPVPIPPIVPKEYPPIPPLPEISAEVLARRVERPHIDEFRRHLNTPPCPMKTNGDSEKKTEPPKSEG